MVPLVHEKLPPLGDGFVSLQLQADIFRHDLHGKSGAPHTFYQVHPAAVFLRVVPHAAFGPVYGRDGPHLLLIAEGIL